MPERNLRILLIDDDEDDCVLTRDLLDEVKEWSYELDWVPTYEEALRVMQRGEHDIHLLDYRLGERNGLELLREAIRGGCQAPVIFLSGQGDRELDTEAIRSGAMDYLVKGKIDATTLQRTIRYAIDRKRMEVEREKLISDLQEALAEIKTLSGLLPICCSCKKVRDDKGYWKQIEYYIQEHSQAEFTHGICPDCRLKLYGC